MNVFTNWYLWLVALWESGNRDEETGDIAATGWSAIYRTEDDDSFEKRPLVLWQLTYKDEVVVSAEGIVFVDNKPPFTEPASSHPRFIGYEREITAIESPFDSRRCDNYESLNEWG